ncbi:MAG: transcription elongation factor GreA [Actinomycetia bacterium]|nr:transcription elongation factor GreA [Actinomycetes bacterium]
MSTDEIWLTQDAYDKLREEYEYLINVGRDEVSTKIARAREEGDLSENAGYHAARDEQGQQELRIRQLKEILAHAQVGTPGSGDTVQPGMKITIAFDGDRDDTDTFLLGSRELVGLDDSVDLAVYSPQSPLGAAITGHQIGDDVSYQAPNGRTITVTIMDAVAY